MQEGSFELNPVLQRPVDAFEWVILGFIPALVRPNLLLAAVWHEMLYRQMNRTRSCLGRWFRFRWRFRSGTQPFELKAEQSTSRGTEPHTKATGLAPRNHNRKRPLAMGSPSQTITITAKFNQAGCDDAAQAEAVGVTNITASATPSTRASRANPA